MYHRPNYINSKNWKCQRNNRLTLVFTLPGYGNFTWLSIILYRLQKNNDHDIIVYNKNIILQTIENCNCLFPSRWYEKFNMCMRYKWTFCRRYLANKIMRKSDSAHLHNKSSICCIGERFLAYYFGSIIHNL